MANKRILFIMHDFSRGGIQSFVYNLIAALPKEAYEPTILYYSDITTMKSEFEECGIPITFFSNTNLKKNYAPFKAVIKEISPDIIHFQGHEGMFIMFLWLWRMGYGKKVLNTFHSTHFDEVRGVEKIKELLVQFCLNKIIHVAKETEIRYSKMYHTLNHKHTTIYNGIRLKELQKSISKETSLPTFSAEYFHILGVATFNPQKGYKYGIPAIAKLITRYPKIRYHILGGAYQHTETYAWAQQYISENDLSKKIILHGIQHNISPYLKSADIFFSPSEKELMPVSYLEALAAGLPIIGTNVGGVPEILGTENEWGILIPSCDEKAIQENIEKLYLDETMRKHYRQQSLLRAKFFDINRIIIEYLEEYEKIK